MKKNKFVFASASAQKNELVPLEMDLSFFGHYYSSFSKSVLRVNDFVSQNPHAVAFLIGVFILVSFLLRF